MTSRALICVTALISCVALACVDVAAANDSPKRNADLTNLAQRKETLAASFAKRAAHCVRRHDTGHFAFHGCIDWHSAVHGNWALLTYAALTGDRKYVALVERILSPDNIDAERKFLKRRPGFERPYGRAWLLRLALAYEHISGRDDLTAVAEDVLQSLIDHYHAHPPDPRSKSYSSASWALINMWDYAEATGNDTALRDVRTWTTEHFAKSGATCPPESDGTSFMAVCTNWAWLASRVIEQEKLPAWLRNFFGGIGPPKPIRRPRDWHQHGLNFSRSWGLWALYEVSGDDVYARAYARHVTTGLNASNKKLKNYRGLGHWIPQFALLAIAPLFDASVSEH